MLWGKKMKVKINCEICGREGFKTLIIWDDEIQKMNEKEIINKIKNFEGTNVKN